MSIVMFYNAAVTCCDKRGQVCICRFLKLLFLYWVVPGLGAFFHIQKCCFQCTYYHSQNYLFCYVRYVMDFARILRMSLAYILRGMT